jgi:hypothetical protein
MGVSCRLHQKAPHVQLERSNSNLALLVAAVVVVLMRTDRTRLFPDQADEKTFFSSSESRVENVKIVGFGRF